MCKLQRGDGPGSHVQLIALPRYLTAGLNYQVTLAGRNFAGWQLDTILYIYIYIKPSAMEVLGKGLGRPRFEESLNMLPLEVNVEHAVDDRLLPQTRQHLQS